MALISTCDLSELHLCLVNCEMFARLLSVHIQPPVTKILNNILYE